MQIWNWLLSTGQDYQLNYGQQSLKWWGDTFLKRGNYGTCFESCDFRHCGSHCYPNACLWLEARYRWWNRAWKSMSRGIQNLTLLIPLAFAWVLLRAVGMNEETAFGLALCFMCLVVGALSFWSYKDRVKRTRKRLENELKKLDEKSTHNSKDNQKQ